MRASRVSRESLDGSEVYAIVPRTTPYMTSAWPSGDLHMQADAEGSTVFDQLRWLAIFSMLLLFWWLGSCRFGMGR